MAGRNFYYDDDGDGIMDDVGYAYFPEDNGPRTHEHYHYEPERRSNHYTPHSSGRITDYIPKSKIIKGILIFLGSCVGISTLGFIGCIIATIIMH